MNEISFLSLKEEEYDITIDVILVINCSLLRILCLESQEPTKEEGKLSSLSSSSHQKKESKLIR